MIRYLCLLAVTNASLVVKKQSLGNCEEHPDYVLFGEDCNQLCEADGDTCVNGDCQSIDPKDNVGQYVGSTIVQNLTHICNCNDGWMGQNCTDPVDSFQQQTSCSKGNFTTENIITGCDCHGTHHHGWHCEIDDTDLCPPGKIDLKDNDGEVGVPHCICDGYMFGEDCDNYCEMNFHCYNLAECEEYSETGISYCHCRNNYYDPQCNTNFNCTEEFCSSTTGSCQAVPPTNDLIACVCIDGFTGDSCRDTDYCFDESCSDQGDCENLDDRYNCTCFDGFYGDKCEKIDYCYNETCSNNGECHNEENSLTCKCFEGYFGEKCETIDYCSEQPCSNGGQCENAENGRTCSCLDGFLGENCDEEDYCFENKCGNNSTCIVENDDFTCQCDDGFTGKLCDEIDHCFDIECKNNGTCTTGADSFECQCMAGFSGPLCDSEIDVCADIKCQNGGICTNGNCQCADFFTGDLCDEKNSCHPDKFECDHGSCQLTVEHPICICDSGYHGLDCSQVDDDTCSLECNHGVCQIESDNATCQCHPGFVGEACDIEANDCSINPCLNDGLCLDGPTCVCQPGFQGQFCQESSFQLLTSFLPILLFFLL